MRVGSLVQEYGARAIDPLNVPTGKQLLFEDNLCTVTGKDRECVPSHVRLYFGAQKMTWIPVIVRFGVLCFLAIVRLGFSALIMCVSVVDAEKFGFSF